MKKAEYIFSPYVQHPRFVDDLEYVASLPKQTIISSLDVLLKSDYRQYYTNNVDKFIERTMIDKERGYAVLKILDYFAYYVVPRFQKKEILSAIEELLPEKTDLRNFDLLIDKFSNNGVREKLEILDLIDDEIGTINQHFLNVTYNIQNRIVMKDNEIIKKLPITTLNFNPSGNNGSKCVFELLGEDIDKLVDILKIIQKKLIKITMEL